MLMYRVILKVFVMKHKKFENLTKYIVLLKNDDIGRCVIDNENDGTLEHPFIMPYIKYSKTVGSFIDDVYKFGEENKHFELVDYRNILKRNGIEWGDESMCNADVSLLDAQCVLAMIMGVLRAERFNDGVLLSFLKRGVICRWLKRLEELDEN